MTKTAPSLLLLLLFLLPSCLARIDIMSIGAHVGSVVSCSSHIRRDLHQPIGSAHGVLLLTASDLCKQLNGLRGAIVGEAKDVEDTRLCTTKLQRVLDAIVGVLSSTTLVWALAFGGLLAAAAQVVRDIRPGGHHGAVFLALNDLCSLLEKSRVAKGSLLSLCDNVRFRLFLLMSATFSTTMQTVKDMKFLGTPQLGPHHGVLWLSLSKMFKCIEKLKTEQVKAEGGVR